MNIYTFENFSSETLQSLFETVRLTALYDDQDNTSQYMEMLKALCVVKMKAQSAAKALDEAEKVDSVASLQQEYAEKISSHHDLIRTVAKSKEYKTYVDRVKEIPSNATMTPAYCESDDGSRAGIDPITKRPIQDPVKNKTCGHRYDREAITGLLKTTRHLKCPVSGCPNHNFIKLSDLIPDHDTAQFDSSPQDLE